MHSTLGRMRVGLLGAGGVVKDMHLPVLRNLDDVTVLWVCDKDFDRARKLARLFGVRSAYRSITECSDVDIVLVAIPVGYRHEVMDDIFRRGWNVFCEKPFALSRAEHEQYVASARANHLQIGVGFLRRYGPATLKAREIVAGRHLGDLVKVWASEGFRTKRTGKDSGWYMTDPRVVGGGVLMETGSHLIDQLCTILGVSSFGIQSCTQTRYADLDFETRIEGFLSSDRDAHVPATIEVSRLEDLCNGIFLQFRSVLLKCGLFFEGTLELLTPDGQPIARLESDGGARTLGQALFLEWKDFVGQCRTGEPSYVDADTAIQSTAIIEQCYDICSRTGSTV